MRAIRGSSTLTRCWIEYTHVLALHESKTLNVNPQLRLIANESSARPLSAAFAAAGVPVLGRIDLEASVGRTRYDGMNISYRRRLHNRFTVNATYTLSRALAYDGGAAAFRNRAVNHFDYFAKYSLGPVPNDTRHRFSMSSVINLPMGLQFAPIMQLESARAYSPSYGGSVDVLGLGAGRANRTVVFTDRPNDLTATLNAFCVTDSLGNHCDPSFSNAVRIQYRDCIRAGQCTISPFDRLRGQRYFQLDTRISKNFRIKEHYVITALFQMFDLTNRANYGNNFGNNVRDLTTFAKPAGFITPNGVIVPHAFSGEFGVKFTF